MPVPPRYTLFHNLELRLDPACAGWITGGELTDISLNKGYFRFRDGRPVDLFALFLIIDAMPPAVMASQGVTAWIPTIELSVNIRNLPKTGSVSNAVSGHVSLPVEFWKPTGRSGMKKATSPQFPVR